MFRTTLYTALLLCAGAAFAQVDTGVITGRVYDNTKAVVSGAQIVILNTGTRYRVELSTNVDGLYVSPALPAGNYRVEVSRQGFGPAVKVLELNINERPAVDFVLEVATTRESVTVEERVSVLQTETTALGTLRTERELRSLPINSRNFAEVIRYTPGVVPAQATKQDLALSQQRGNASNSVNGALLGDNNFLVDGLQNNNNHQGFGLVNYPEIEAIEQYRIETSVPDARFGRSGGTVNVSYKSGTTEFHGALFEFMRNSALDARNFFATGKKPSLNRHMFGGTLGGPIGGKAARTFFFVSYEAQRNHQGQTFLSTVPTSAMREGDFDELLRAAQPLVLYDPLTTRPSPSGTGMIRDAFPGNRIPSSRFNPASKKIMDLYPAPNGAGIASNYLLNPKDRRNTDQGTAKIDRDFSGGSRAFFRLTRADSTFLNTRNLGPQATPYYEARVPVTQGVLSYMRIISSRLFFQSRFGVSREPVRSQELNGNRKTAEEFGIPNVNVDDLSMGLPIINVSGMSAIGGKGNNPAILASQNVQWGSNVEGITGNHSLRAGFDVVFRQMNAFQAATSRSQMSFGTLYTSNPASALLSGAGAGDLLLGKPGTINLDWMAGTRGLRRSDWAMFFQDDWKVAPGLTVNLGLRYEIPLHYPTMEVCDRMLQFDLESGLSAPVGKGKFPWRSGVPTDLNNLAPRFGLAYRLGNNTAVRAAYGIYYSLVPIAIAYTLAANPPYFVSTLATNNQNDFPGARAITDGPIRVSDPNAPGQNRLGSPLNFRVPYVQQWNISLQRQLPGQQQLTVSYVGTKGTRLDAGWQQITGININQAVPGDGPVNLRRPWPQYGNVTIHRSDFNSTYHSLQAALVKRWANSMNYQIAYTWSHSIDGVDIANLPVTDLSGAKGNSNTDLRHQVRTTFGSELPFGRGKRIAGPGWANFLMGGWETNGALTLYGGFPFTVLAGSNTLNIGQGTRADRLRSGELPKSQRSVQRWFDLDAFANPGFRKWGNGGRNILRGPGTKYLDWSLFKNFRIGEGKLLQFRAEMFNVTNTPQFNEANSTIGSQSSGRITIAGSELTLQRTQRQIQLALKLTF